MTKKETTTDFPRKAFDNLAAAQSYIATAVMSFSQNTDNRERLLTFGLASEFMDGLAAVMPFNFNSNNPGLRRQTLCEAWEKPSKLSKSDLSKDFNDETVGSALKRSIYEARIWVETSERIPVAQRQDLKRLMDYAENAYEEIKTFVAAQQPTTPNRG